MKLLPKKTPEHRKRIEEHMDRWIDGLILAFSLTMGAILLIFLWISWV